MDIEKTNANPPREKLFLLWNSIQRILPDLNADDSKLAGYLLNTLPGLSVLRSMN